MKFFIPEAKDANQAERFWVATKTFAEKTLGWKVSNRRIFSIDFSHDGKDRYVEVGKPDPDVGEIVIAILESNAYLVCTANRGVRRGMPLLVGKEEARQVMDFEDSPA